jgi:hypothetical protein
VKRLSFGASNIAFEAIFVIDMGLSVTEIGILSMKVAQESLKFSI